MDIIELIAEEEGCRIDRYLSERMEFSRSYLSKLIDDKNVTVDGRVVKASFKLSKDDKIRVEIPPAKDTIILPENIPLKIVYEDEDVILIDKPKNMVVHPAPGHYQNTLVNALMYHCKDGLSGINGELRPGIVHRIDKDTTGIIIACKNDLAHREIAKQLKEHTIKRKYQAVVHGNLDADGIISMPIGRDRIDRKKMSVVANGSGKEAITHYRLIKNYKTRNGSKFAHIECILETGRTHQIRVHMSYIGHPLLGDDVYGRANKKLIGQTLHAEMLGFIHPRSKEYMEFHSDLPEYFKKLLQSLENEN